MTLDNTYTVTESSFDSLNAYWPDRQHRLKWDCLFVLPGWLKVWWQTFGSGQTPYLCSIRCNDELIGIAPLMVEGQTALLMGDDEVCDYLDVVVAPGREKAFCTALISHLRQQGVRQMDLGSVRADSVVFSHLAPAARENHCTVTCQPVDAAMELALPASWEAYLLQLSGKQRHEVRRKLRRLEEAGRVTCRFVDDAAEVSREMDIFLALFKRNRADKARFMTAQMTSFFHALAAEMAAVRLLKLFFLELDDVLAAAVMCFDYDATFYLYNNGYDQKYHSLSVGLLSKLFTIKESILQGKEKYDFLKGTEVYKHRLGGTRIPLYRCRVRLD